MRIRIIFFCFSESTSFCKYMVQAVDFHRPPVAKVMFPVVCVCAILSSGGGVPVQNPGPLRHIQTFSTWNLTVQGARPPTCSNLFTVNYWKAVGIQLKCLLVHSGFLSVNETAFHSLWLRAGKQKFVRSLKNLLMWIALIIIQNQSNSDARQHRRFVNKIRFY